MSERFTRILLGLSRIDEAPAYRGHEQVVTGVQLRDSIERAMGSPNSVRAPGSRETASVTSALLQRLSMVQQDRHEDSQPSEVVGKPETAAIERDGYRWSPQQFSTWIEDFGRRIESAGGDGLVLGSLSGMAGDAALAAWGGGQAVTHRSSSTPAGRLLALLAGGQFAWAVLPVDSLRSALRHAALELEDYPALRVVFYDATGSVWLNKTEQEQAASAFLASIDGRIVAESGMATEAADQSNKRAIASQIEQACAEYEGVDAVGAVMGSHGWRVYIAPARRESKPDCVAIDALIKQVAKEMETEFESSSLAASVEAFDGLGRIALTSMIQAFRRCGAFGRREAWYTEAEVFAKASVATEHRPLVRRWLRVLAEEGLLDFNGTSWRVVAPESRFAAETLAENWAQLSEQWQATAGAVGTVDYARRSAAYLPELLRGERAAVHLLFPEGRTEDARALYRENIAARFQHRAASRWLAAMARVRDGGRPLRILEVGGGTGATTESMLAELSEFDVEYVFSDVSKYFLDQAAAWLSKFPSVRLALYDIDRCPIEQGVAPASFDVVVAGGVLNAARDTDQSIGWLRQVLRPGGFLVLTEPTREEYWVMASQAFMLADAEDDRSHSGSTFLSHEQWLGVFQHADLRCLLDLPDRGHALNRLGHRVFVARRPLDRVDLPTEAIAEKILQRSPSLRLSGIEVDAALPVDDIGRPDRARLEARAAQQAEFELFDPAVMSATEGSAPDGSLA